MNDKPGFKRCVYLIPDAMLAEVRAFQVKHVIASEAEAVRRLMADGLGLRDTVETLQARLKAVHSAGRKTLREVASEVLAAHPLVARMEFYVDRISFALRDGSTGAYNLAQSDAK